VAYSVNWQDEIFVPSFAKAYCQTTVGG